VERRISFALAGTGILAALLLLTVGQRRGVSAHDVERVSAELEALVREATASGQARADTLAQLPRLGWLIATDAATVGDLTADELEFSPHPGEHIELAQIRVKDGLVRVLRRLPAKGAIPLPVAQPGLHLLVSTEQIDVVVVVTVPPRLRERDLRGGLAVARTLDTSRLVDHLDALGVSASLNNARGTAWLGHGPHAHGRGTTPVVLESPAGKDATLLIAAPGTSWLRAMTWLLVCATLVLAVVFWRRSGGAWLPVRLRSAATPPPGPTVSVATVPAPDTDDEQPDSDLTYDPDATMVASPGPPHATHARPRTGAVPILPASTMPGAPRRPTPLPGAAPDALADEYRALYAEFLSLRRTTGESVSDLDREQFVETLRHTRQDLMATEKAQDVQFRLVFQNGKAVIRFTTVL